MKARLTLAFALLLCCIGTGAALALGTPDGLPPARESVCDAETGAAYGLCNAYCEAMDCELANDGDPGTEPHASATACSKVRSKFQNVTGRDVTCEACPCASIPGFIATLSSINYCIHDPGIPAIIVSTDPFGGGPSPSLDSSMVPLLVSAHTETRRQTNSSSSLPPR